MLQAGSAEPNSWWTTTNKVAEASYNLGAGAYKPRIAEKASDEDPIEMVSDVLVDYKKVVAGLEKLKAEWTQ